MAGGFADYTLGFDVESLPYYQTIQWITDHVKNIIETLYEFTCSQKQIYGYPLIAT